MMGSGAAQLIADSGKIYIPLCAICGSLILDLFGPGLLRMSAAQGNAHAEATEGERERWKLGWKARFRNWRADSKSNVPLDPLNQLEAFADASFVSAVESWHGSLADADELAAQG